MTEQHTILVTGGSGYIGSVVCQMLVEQGYAVINIDRDKKKREIPGVTLYPFDISNPQVQGIIQLMRPVAIIHLAADNHTVTSISDPGTYYHNNVSNTIDLLNSAVKAGVENFVYVSSSSVYGDANSFPTSETQTPLPINPYGRSKWMAEQLIQDYSAAHQIRTATVRLFSVAGADLERESGYHQTPVRHLIPEICQCVEKSQTLTIHGDQFKTTDGTAHRDFTHVTDAASGILSALEYVLAGGLSDTFNIASGNSVSIQQVLETFTNTLGVAVNSETAGARPGEAHKTHADISKARKILGWAPEYGIGDIVEHAHAWHNKKGKKRQ